MTHPKDTPMPMNELAAKVRFHVGRAVIVFGIALLPESRAKLELTDMLELWTAHVRAAIATVRKGTQP